ncbi:MAG TPA: CAP domain-containing protein, partial [Myxococcota bacterium]|nr:CAP domain-containing protein [Myxococcota bacterium]
MPTTLVRAVAFLLGFWLALLLLQPLAARANARDDDLRLLEDGVYSAINATRAGQQRGPLERVPALDAVAREHSADMAARHYLSHDTPEGLNPVDRIQRGGVDGMTLAGENVGLTNRANPNREIVEGWIASPVHRANLLHPAFNATGVGIARAADGTLYYTQVFVTFPKP